jgi:hypothetical protein
VLPRSQFFTYDSGSPPSQIERLEFELKFNVIFFSPLIFFLLFERQVFLRQKQVCRCGTIPYQEELGNLHKKIKYFPVSSLISFKSEYLVSKENHFCSYSKKNITTKPFTLLKHKEIRKTFTAKSFTREGSSYMKKVR